MIPTVGSREMTLCNYLFHFTRRHLGTLRSSAPHARTWNLAVAVAYSYYERIRAIPANVVMVAGGMKFMCYFLNI